MWCFKRLQVLGVLSAWLKEASIIGTGSPRREQNEAGRLVEVGLVKISFKLASC